MIFEILYLMYHFLYLIPLILNSNTPYYFSTFGGIRGKYFCGKSYVGTEDTLISSLKSELIDHRSINKR